MTDLLSEVEYGRILGSFTAVAEDFGDTVAPDAIPLTGRVTFVPSKSNISYINSEGETASLYVAPVNAVISQGRIVGKDGKDGVVLLASNSNNVSASVLWNARISLDPIHAGDEAPEVHDFLIEVRRGEVASLIDVIKENSRVHNIALFHDAIAEAAAKFWERVEAGEFRGNQGPPGPAGIGIGVAGPAGRAGKSGRDGDPGVGGNLLPDGNLEEPGFLVTGDMQETSDAVMGDKAVTLSNATSRKIAIEPEKSYVGSVYVKSADATTVSISQRVFGAEGDIDRVIENSYDIPANTWKKLTFLLDTNVGDQSMEIVTQADGRTITVDQYTLSDNSVVKGLQKELTSAKALLEGRLAQLDTELEEVDSERQRLATSLNDLATVLEDSNVDLTELNEDMANLKTDLVAEQTARQEADAAAQLVIEQLDTNIADAKTVLDQHKTALETLDLTLEESQTVINGSKAKIEELETQTLPNLKKNLEDADAAAQETLASLDARIATMPTEEDLATVRSELVDARGVADAAKVAAEEANTAANSASQAALEAAGIASSKGRVIVQETEPQGEDRTASNIWIKPIPDDPTTDIEEKAITYVYLEASDEWQPTTSSELAQAAQNALDAREAAQQAQQRADTAISNAATAQGAAEAAQRTADQATLDARSAHNEAVAAQEAAEEAAKDAANRARVVYQDTAPEPSPDLLWFDTSDNNTPKVWDNRLGDEPRQNLVYNPSPLTSTGWSGPALQVVERDGKRWAQATSYGNSTPYLFSALVYENFEEGEVITFRAQVGSENHQGQQANLRIASHVRNGNKYFNPAGGFQYVPVDEWASVCISLPLPEAVSSDGGLDVSAISIPASVENARLYMADVAIERGDTSHLPYFDGETSPLTRWEGEPHASASVYDGPQWVPLNDPGVIAAQAAANAAQERADEAIAEASVAKGLAEDAVREVGDTVRDTSIEYAVSTSETEAPTSGWSTSTPTRTPGSFVWMRTIVTYADGDTSTTSPVLLTGNTGAKGDPGSDGVSGKDGLGLKSTALSYALSTSGTTAPSSGWTTTVPTPIKGRYMWTRTVWTYTDNTSETGYSVAYLATDGAKGSDGIAGKDGVGITGTAITYAVSSSGTTAPTSGWVANPPAATAGQFMWTKTVWTYSDSTTETGYSVGKIGNTGPQGLPGSQGPQGDTGATGVSITAVTPFFRAVARTASAPAQPTGTAPSGWTTTEPAWNSANKLYRAERITYSNGTTAWTAVSLVATYEGIVSVNASVNGKNSITRSTSNASGSGVVAGDQWVKVDAAGDAIAQWFWDGSAWKPALIKNDMLESLDVHKLQVTGTASIKDAVIDKVWADGISARTATFNRLTVSPGNIVPDPKGLVKETRDLLGGSPWTWIASDGGYWERAAATGATSQFNAYPNLSGTIAYDMGPITPNAEYRISYDIWVDGSATAGKNKARAAINYRKLDGTTSFVGDGAGDGDADAIGTEITTGEWVHVERTWVAPDDAVSGGFSFQLVNTGNDATVVRIRNPYVGVKAGAVSIENGAVNADKINAESVAGAVGKFVKVEAGNIVAGSADIDSLVAQKIAASTAAFQTVNADKIIASTGTMDSATIDQIWADGIAAKAITTNKLTIAASNVYSNPGLVDQAGWGSRWSASGGFGGGGVITVESRADGAQRGGYDSLSSPVPFTQLWEGQSFVVSVMVKPSDPVPAGSARILLRAYEAQGSSDFGWASPTTITNAVELPAGQWSKVTGKFTMPAGSPFLCLGTYLQDGYTGSAEFSDISVVPQVGSVLIENGAISANHISSDSIDTAHLRANAVSAEKILAGAVTTDKMTANSINGDRIKANTLDAGKITANTITATQIKAETISAAEIASRTITAEKINTGAITANEIKARSITAAEIATGTITAEEIAGRTITAENIETSTITTNELDVENITASTAIIDGLWVNGLNTKTLSTSRLSVEPGNSFPDPFFQDKGKWENSDVQILADGPNPLDSFLRITTTSSQVGSYYGGADSQLVSLTPGTTYHLQMDLRRSSGASSLVAVYLRGRDVTGGIKTISSSFTPTNSGSEWVTYSASITVPHTHQYMHTVGLYTRAPYYAGETVDFRNVRVVPKVSTTLIEDGAVTTQTMAANSIDGDRIRAGTIVAEKITGGSFEGKTFKGGTFEGGLVVGGIVSTSMYASTTGGVHLSTAYGLRAWNSSGTQTVSIDPKNGDLRMGAGVYLTGSDRNGLVLNPPSKIGTASIYFSKGESLGASDAAIWRPGYTNRPEHLRIRGANGEGIYVQGGLSEFQYSVNVGSDLSVGGVSFLGETYMYGYLRYEGAPSSGVSNANLYMNPNNKIIARMTSSRRYKENIRDWSADPEAVLALRPRTWQATTPMEGDDPEAWFVGFVAEEVHDLGLNELVQYDTEGRPDALHYATFSVAQQAVLIKHEEDIKGLISRIKMLEEKL